MRAQGTEIILLTPPPVNEHQFEETDLARKASVTQVYAEAAREVGASLGVAVADVWTEFMTAAGWQEGDALVGSREIPNNATLQGLLSDGEFCFLLRSIAFLVFSRCLLDPGSGTLIVTRTAFDARRISESVRGGDADCSEGLSGAFAGGRAVGASPVDGGSAILERP